MLFPKAVYEDLRERMKARVEAVIGYAYGDETQCREHYMLAYFGEQREGRCGHCDNCMAARKRASYTVADVQEGILYMAQLKPREDIAAAVAFLVDEGFLRHLPDDTYHNPVPLR